MKKGKNVSLKKKYKLPVYEIEKYYKKTIVIFHKIGKWIVLNNDLQFEIFEKLACGVSVGELCDFFQQNKDDLVSVLVQLEAKRIERTRPITNFEKKIHLHITNKCNLLCPHCYMFSGHEMDNELDTTEIKILCKDMYEYGVRKISFTGGEPLVRKDFFEILKYTSDLGYGITIFTNGYLWSEEMVKLIKLLNIDGVQVSIDGFDEETNSIVRGKNAFMKALDTIDLMHKNGLNVKIAVTAPFDIMKKSKEKYVSFAKNILNKYHDEVSIEFSYSFMPGRELSLDVVNKNSKEYHRMIDDVTKKIYGDTSKETFIDSIYGGYINDSCGYGALSIMPNGDYYFCDRITDSSKIGNIRNVDTYHLYKQMMAAAKKGKIDNFMPCSNCNLKYICGGGCRAIYFNDFTSKNKNSNKFDFSNLKERKCGKREKNKILSLMVKTNEDFFE